MHKLRVGSLFSGIGGLDLGLERAGMEIIWHSEIEPFAVGVLSRHWPSALNHGDITKIEWSDVERPDLLCGGFPCQDLSSAHTGGAGRLGLSGPKSGLWAYFRVGIAALRPAWVVVENVNQYHGWVTAAQDDLADLGYASVPVQVPAGAVGAPHIRRRIFLVANADPSGEPTRRVYEEARLLSQAADLGSHWPDAPVGPVRVDDGFPARLVCQAYGNAVVPACAELVGRLIVAASR